MITTTTLEKVAKLIRLKKETEELIEELGCCERTFDLEAARDQFDRVIEKFKKENLEANGSTLEVI